MSDSHVQETQPGRMFSAVLALIKIFVRGARFSAREPSSRLLPATPPRFFGDSLVV